MRTKIPRQLILVLFAVPLSAQQPFDVKGRYAKEEHQIEMRDGVKLFTSVYRPKDTSHDLPILMLRTPYGVGPYGEEYRTNLGPSTEAAEEGFIFVYQDVRGR